MSHWGREQIWLGGPRETNRSYSIACLHEKKRTVKYTFLFQLPLELQAKFKLDLLLMLQQEQSKNVRKKIADLVAEVMDVPILLYYA